MASAFFGLDLVRKKNITNVIVLGDLKQVIQKMRSGYSQGVVRIRRIYDLVCHLSVNLQITYFHILRGNNFEANNLANQGAKLEMGLALIKDQIIFFMFLSLSTKSKWKGALSSCPSHLRQTIALLGI